jgi:uncharacterized membrane protein YbhN (UPF0104 family)
VPRQGFPWRGPRDLLRRPARPPLGVAYLTPNLTLPRSVATARRRALLAAIALAVSVGLLALLALAAGWEGSVSRLERARWPLLAAVIASHLIAYAGYTAAHHRVLNLRRGARMGWRETALALVVGFGALPAKGGFTVDRAALVSVGSSREEATIWSITLALIELALLAFAAWVCSLPLIGAHGVPDSESVPWAILVPLLAVPVLIASAHARRQQPVHVAHWRAWIQQRLRAIALTIDLARNPREGGPVFLGIALYSAAGICALAISLRLCHVHLGLARLILAYATGYALTRRTLPLAGAGATDVLLCLALTWVGLPLQAAIPAVLVYRLSDLALTLPPSLATDAAFIRFARLDYAAGDRRRSIATDTAPRLCSGAHPTRAWQRKRGADHAG